MQFINRHQVIIKTAANPQEAKYIHWAGSTQEVITHIHTAIASYTGTQPNKAVT